ncbi:hypothetical protein ElyMa_002682600 [Elysia marginata]|uniref:Uncharacterized protein n=1 Tax=Elysia marginata TaxID=1093978 RepID=A0AAV4HA69_9GAST|nr:hypothetical protein ElyMa_002682600 [Elysia marginata]
MESTSQRYATFLRQWKKRHNYSQLHNHYLKYERLPKCTGRGNGECFFGTDDKMKASPNLHGNSKLQPLQHRTSRSCKKGKPPVTAVSHFPKQIEASQKQMELNDVIKNPPAGLFRQEPHKEKSTTMFSPTRTPDMGLHHKQKRKTRGLDDIPLVDKHFQNNCKDASRFQNNSNGDSCFHKNRDDPWRFQNNQDDFSCFQNDRNHPSSFQKNRHSDSPHFVSSAELADMEFWLLYGESAHSAASHFSYALLARIDQLLAVPAGGGSRSRTLKTTIQQKAISHIQRENIQADIQERRNFNFQQPISSVVRQNDRTKAKTKESCVYWNHDSDCADKYRIHILKVMKKTKKSCNRGKKKETLDKCSQTLDSVEEVIAEDNSQDLDRVDTCSKGDNRMKNSKSKSVSKEDLQNIKSSISDDGGDKIVTQKIHNVKSLKNRDLLVASKLQLNPSKSSADKKLPRRTVASISSLIAMPSTASTKQDRGHSINNVCVPSAGSSVTVYPRCPLDSGTSSVSEDSALEKEVEIPNRVELQGESRFQKCVGRQAGSGMEGQASTRGTHEDVSQRDCGEKQDIISVSIRLHNKHRLQNSRQTSASPSLFDKLQRLGSASGVDSSRKCNQWLNEKCPKQ